MTDTDNTTEQTETTFGIDTTEITARYHKALKDAEHVYQTINDTFTEKLSNAHYAVTQLLADTPGGRDINRLLTTLSQPLRDKMSDAAVAARDRMIRHAEDEKDEALKADPFTAYVITSLNDRIGWSRTQHLIDNAPFTFASLRQLADDKDWCDEFEMLAEEAAEAGVLPNETRTVTREIRGSLVPDEHNPKNDEQWLAHLTLPAYMRDTNRYGDPIAYSELRDDATSITYEKAPAIPEQRSADDDT